MPEPQLQLSVIIVTHNSRPALDLCLDSLTTACRDLAWELIVVDNYSRDRSVAAVRRVFPDAMILAFDTNRGFAAAVNQGSLIARGEYLLLLNPDVEVDLDSITNLIEVSGRTERPGLLSARMRNEDGSFQSTCRRFPSLTNLLHSRGSFLARLREENKDTTQTYTLGDYDETTTVPAAAATMVLVRKGTFEKVGRFDERFFLFMEDTDLSLRLFRSGHRNMFVPTAGGVHGWGRGSRAGRIVREWHHHYSLWLFFRKHHGWLVSLVLLPPMLFLHLMLVTLITPFSSGRR